MDCVEKHLSERCYAGDHEFRDRLIEIYLQYRDWGLKDSKFDKDFTDGRDEHFYGYLWEMLLAHHFHKLDLTMSSADEGPDFKLGNGEETVWVEAICPSPDGLPKEWLKEPVNGVHHFPHEQILLRWTAALKEKKKSLLAGWRKVL